MFFWGRRGESGGGIISWHPKGHNYTSYNLQIVLRESLSPYKPLISVAFICPWFSYLCLLCGSILANYLRIFCVAFVILKHHQTTMANSVALYGIIHLLQLSVSSLACKLLVSSRCPDLPVIILNQLIFSRAIQTKALLTFLLSTKPSFALATPIRCYMG